MQVYLREQVGSSPLHMPVVLSPFSKQVLDMSPLMLNPGLQEYTAVVPKAQLEPGLELYSIGSALSGTAKAGHEIAESEYLGEMKEIMETFYIHDCMYVGVECYVSIVVY